MNPADDLSPLSRPLALPCGAVLSNRLAKSAMSDSLGDGAGNPTPAQARLYERWAQGGLTLSIVGEVQSDPHALEKPGNLVLDTDCDLAEFSELTARATAGGAHLWAQLGHAGALAYPPLGRPLGPSALDLPGLVCAQMTPQEIEALPALFAGGAQRAQTAGFTGVQIHAAHGFLLSQFLSPLFNRRTDRWGGTLERRAQILLYVIAAVRAAVGPAFPVGVKLNASDMLDGGFREAEAENVVAMLDETAIDLIEISAGTYFPGAEAASETGRTGPYFLDFARRARQRTAIALMAAGGFKQRAQALAALQEGALDLIGLARPMVLEPALPEKWMTVSGGDPAFPRFPSPSPGAVTAWYTMRIDALAEDREAGFDMDADTALRLYDARDAARHPRWRARFGTGRDG